MKAIILSVAFTMFAAFSGFAQTNQTHQEKTPEERATRQTEVLEKRLSLTPEQRSKVYQVNLKRAGAMEKFRSEDRGNKKERMEDRQKLMSKSDKDLEKILNDDQLKIYRDQKEKMKKNGNKGQEHKGNRHRKN